MRFTDVKMNRKILTCEFHGKAQWQKGEQQLQAKELMLVPKMNSTTNKD